MNKPPSILVIKHGALGDIILATAAFEAIRQANPEAEIVLLTTKPYASLLAGSPYFNEIWVDSKPKLFDRKGRRNLKTMLNSRQWDFVYDLQNSQRTTFYQWLLKRPWPKISNASRWVSHPRGKYDTTKHALVNIQNQIAKTGLSVGQPDIGWMNEPMGNLTLPQHFALLVPGGAAHRPEKRWPAEQYAALASELAAKGITPVLIGTHAESEALNSIAARVPHTINLCGKTSIPQLAMLAREAQLAVGNDTGPMHVIAAAGCPSTVIFSYASDPVRSAPIGNVKLLRERDLSQLTVDRVLVSLTGRA
jgi:ADP-heptose:LPS heptosyltransferase